MTLGNITKIPDDADSLILINPETDFTLSEVGIITKYWEEQRGALVLLLNPSIEMPNFYPFLRSLGIRVDNKYRVLFSETTGIGGAQKIYEVQSKLLSENPITSNDSGKITTFAGQTCPLSVAENNEMLLAKGIIATPLMVADPKFWEIWSTLKAIQNKAIKTCCQVKIQSTWQLWLKKDLQMATQQESIIPDLLL